MKYVKVVMFQFILTVFLFQINCGFAFAQSNEITSLNFTVETVDERLKKALADEKLSEENKNTLKDLAQKTKLELKSLHAWREKSAFYQKTIDLVPEKIKEYKDKDPKQELTSDRKNLSLITLEQQQAQFENELGQIEKENNQLSQEANKRAERRIEIPKLVLDIKGKLNQLQNDLSELPQKEVVEEISVTKSMLIKANILSLKNEIEAYEKELRMYAATINLIPVKQDFLNKKIHFLKETISEINKELTKKRTEEVEALARKTQTKSTLHPAVKELAQSNQDLASQLTGSQGIVKKLDKVTKQSDKAMKDLKDIDKLFSDIKSKVDATGMTPALGLYMRNKKNSLSGLVFYLQDSKSLMAEVQTQLLQLEDERNELSNIDGVVAALIEKFNGPLEQTERIQIAESAKKNLELRVDLLDKMIKNLNLYFIELVELDTYQRLLISKVKQFRSFVDEHLIWYKSAPGLNFQDFQNVWVFGNLLLKPQEWDSACFFIYNDFKKDTFLYGCFLLFILILLFFRKRFDKVILSLSDSVMKHETDSLGCTFKGILVSLLRILAMPAAFLFIGWRLQNVVDGNLFIHGLALGFTQSGIAFLVLKTTAVFCKQGGVGDIQFKWNSESLTLIRKHLHWFTPITVALFFISALLSDIPADNLVIGKSFHRFLFLIRILVSAVFLFKVVNPVTGPVRRFLDKRKGSLSERLRYLWYLPSIIYLFLGILALMGYFYTAQQFDLRIQKSFVLFIFVSFIYGLSFRWLFFVRRKLALERARKKQEAKDLSQQSGASGNEEIAQDTESLYEMGQDTKKILATFIFIIVLFSLWFIWKDLLPALNMFNRINLWSNSQMVTEAIDTSDAGAGGVRTIPKIIPVTLADLMIAIVILLLSFIIVRNISGIIQMLILQHLPLDQGTRFAIITITRYAITLIGVLIACAFIGVSWSKVQWLVAAVSVGLGFGLQEIFANFISGLIILMEQPIRVGDVVTVGEVTGYVTQIKIRATTITDLNKKELIVPNKEFITSRLVNWSLSDKVIRLTIPVGIAYGSDTKKAEKILYKVAEEQPDVLPEPPPIVLFNEFAESSLAFELRVFIPSFDYFIKTRHDLHMKIDSALRKSGIEIAFPQRDIHIRSIETALKLDQASIKK